MANLLPPSGTITTLDQVRAERCLKEIQDVLRRNQCQILPQIVFVGQVMQSTYIVVANTAVPPDLRGEKGIG